jgi:hypothetical protein
MSDATIKAGEARVTLSCQMSDDDTLTVFRLDGEDSVIFDAREGDDVATLKIKVDELLAALRFLRVTP